MLRVLATNEPISRFGFTTRKALGNAVVRNRLKRRLREAVRVQPVTDGWDAVINARRGAESASYQRLTEELNNLMERAGLLGQKGVAPE